jgi:copper transport protein
VSLFTRASGLDRVLRVLVVLVLVVLWASATAATAWGHATLVTTSPGDDSVLAQAPGSVSLRFDEPVETAFGALRVYDGRGRRVDDGAIRRPRGSTIGAFVFSVGARAAGGLAAAARIEAGQEPARSVSAGFGVARFVAFLLVLLITGSAIALAVVFAGHRRDAQRRVERTLAFACLGLLPVTMAGLVYEAAAAGGFGLREAAHPSVLRAVLGTTFGTVWALRAGLAVLLAGILVAARRFRGQIPVWLRACIALCGAAVGVSTTGASHAWAEGRLAMIFDGTHLLAAAIWTGGLLSLVLVLRQTPAGDRWRLAARIVPRFSNLAVGAVAVLVLAGIASAYVEVGAWRGLWDTTYGQLVLGKAALLVPLLGLGAFNNRVAVPQLRRGIGSAREQQRFARTVAAEVCLMLAVVGLTAALVQQRPARSLLTATGPYSATSQIGPYELDLVVDPARVGRGQIHLYLLDRSGQPARGIAEVRLAASLTRPRLGPLRYSSTPAGPGHFIAPATQFPIAGSWRLTTRVRRGEFDQWSVTTTIPIR